MKWKSEALKWVGVIAIVGFGVVGIVSLGLVKDRVTVTISEESDPDQLDPVALLRDEVAVLRGDVSSLANTLAENLQILAESLDETELRNTQAMDRRFAQLEASLESFQQQLATLQAQSLAAADNPETSMTNQSEPAVTDPLASERSSAPIEPAAPRKKRGFLAFRLPSQGFDFNRRQRFEIITSLSRVGFDAKSTLHDFTGVSSDVSGQLILNLGDAATGIGGAVSANAKALKTGVAGRDENMYEHLATTQHPDLVFQVEGFETTQADEKSMTVSGTILGTMTIRGVSQKISMPVEISVDPSRRLVLEGQMPLDITDYDIAVPTQFGVIGMEEEVSVWVSLRARSLGAAVEN